MKLTVLMPAQNEEKNVRKTIDDIFNILKSNRIDHEILVVNDNSSDRTKDIVETHMSKVETLRLVSNPDPKGFGTAVRCGFEHMRGDAVCIMMADGSDSPDDLLIYAKKIIEGYDCVFGSRFIKGAHVVDYPIHKLILNRIGNYFIKFFLGVKHNDITNGFKCYKKEVIDGIKPIFSNHFNLTVELPLKAIIRGYDYSTVPIKWFNRTEGFSKFKIREMGSRYLFIICYIFIEKHLSRGDYLRKKDKKND